MQRFIALVWDEARGARPDVVEACRASLDAEHRIWSLVLDAPGLCVFARREQGQSARAVKLRHEDGVVLGALFRRCEEAKGPRLLLDRRESARLVETAGDSLIGDYWGAYVVFWRNALTREIGVLRDPSGSTPCYHTRLGDVDLYFAHAEDAARLPGVRFHVDWTALRAFLTFAYFVTPVTALEEAQELLPGQRRLRQSAQVRCDFAWNGATIAAQRTPPRSYEDARERLRETGLACFAAWGGAFDHVVVSLSGGLDSSLLLGLLGHTSKARITALHYLGLDYERQEAALARKAAERAGVELVNFVQDPARENVAAILDGERMARPKVQTLAVGIDKASRDLAVSCGAQAFMLGHGGDNLFLQRATAAHTLSDYVHDHGWGHAVLQQAYWAAMLQERPVATMVARALGARFAHRWRPFAALDHPAWREASCITQDAPALPQCYTHHPWFFDAAPLARGKAEQLASIVALYRYHLDHGRGLSYEVVYPWMSQPLLELALATPSYYLAHGARDRALEREAFAEFAPAAILRRTDKGASDLYLLNVLRHHADFFRQCALDGDIAREPWIDRARLERALSPSQMLRGEGAGSIYALVAAEAWLQAWRGGAIARTPTQTPICIEARSTPLTTK